MNPNVYIKTDQLEKFAHNVALAQSVMGQAGFRQTAAAVRRALRRLKTRTESLAAVSYTHLAGRAVIEQAGYGAYFGHAFGHSLGLEIHEAPNASPSCTEPIPAGAVISAEPGIYLPGRFGVRIEDVLYITEDGCEDLTKTPRDLVVL